MALASAGLQTHIYNNNLKSVFLLASFPLLLAGMLGCFFGFFYGLGPAPLTLDAFKAGAEQGLLSYGHYAFLAAGIWFIIAFLFHGQMMQASSGARPVTREEMPKIYNLLENLCITKGLQMPQFEVIDSPALNAYATGISNNTYKIVLSRGIIEKLDDDELESVMGHELTHIINRDVRLLIISVIFVGMISFLCHMLFRFLINGGLRINHYSRDDNKQGGGTALMMLLAFAILAVGYLFALVIRFTLSRKREFLADAGSVEITHKPEAMMRALLRISGQDQVSGMSGDVQQMCIENSHNFMGIFATHPPISDRVAAISQATGVSIPTLQTTLRRTPKNPWSEKITQ